MKGAGTMYLVVGLILTSCGEASDVGLGSSDDSTSTQSDSTITSGASASALYGGGPFYTKRTSSIPEVKKSGFTHVIVWTIHMAANGDLNFNGEFPVVSDGSYTGNATHPDFASDMMLLKTAPTSVRRLEVGLSAWGSDTFANIKSLVASQGTGPTSILYRNFAALKAAIPAFDAVNFDDEKTYDVSSSVQFAVMLADLGYKVALCPYTSASYWTSVASQTNRQRPGAVDLVYLQSYAGGSGNTPCSWNFGGIPVYPGMDSNSGISGITPQMESWKRSCGTTGGFIWLYDQIQGSAASYAAALNDVFAPAASGSAVSLPSYFDVSDGLVADGTTFSRTGGLDGVGFAYPSSAVGSAVTWNGAVFTIGPPNTADVVSATGQTIALPTGNFSYLRMLATAVNGNRPQQPFEVTYSDGTTSTFTQGVSDWYTPQSYAGESRAVALSYRNKYDGQKDSRNFYLYGYSFHLANAKTVKSVTLPSNPNVKVLAMTLVP